MRSTCATAILIALLTLASCARPSGDAAVAASAGHRWLKGNLHTHSLWSDGDDFPEMIADWYKSRGYDFLGLSDHNILQDHEKWMTMAELKKRGATVALDKYRVRFPDRVRTRGEGTDVTEVRLATLPEIKSLLEEPGKFLLIPAEEISDRFEKLPIHINATNVAEVVKPQGGSSVREVIANNLRAVREQAERTGRPILPHLNHPNFGYGVAAEDLAHVVEEQFFEIYNGHPGVNQRGDAWHLSVEQIWDVANTIRLTELNAPPLLGIATDDSHHYHTPGMSRSTSGRGWTMVRAAELTAESIIAAMRAGDCYASSGVLLRDVRYDGQRRRLELDILPDGAATFTTRFVGSRRSASDGGGGSGGGDSPPPGQVGVVFKTVRGRTPSYTLRGDELYVRAIVTSSAPHDNPSLEAQRKQAWTQPVGWTISSTATTTATASPNARPAGVVPAGHD